MGPRGGSQWLSYVTNRIPGRISSQPAPGNLARPLKRWAYAATRSLENMQTATKKRNLGVTEKKKETVHKNYANERLLFASQYRSAIMLQ